MDRNKTTFKLNANQQFSYLMGGNEFSLKVDECTITSIKVLYSTIKEKYDTLSKDIAEQESDGQSEVHPTKYDTRYFFKNILDKMDKIEGIQDNTLFEFR